MKEVFIDWCFTYACYQKFQIIVSENRNETDLPLVSLLFGWLAFYLHTSLWAWRRSICCALSPGRDGMRLIRCESMLARCKEPELPTRMNSCGLLGLEPACCPLSPGNDGIWSDRECTATEKKLLICCAHPMVEIVFVNVKEIVVCVCFIEQLETLFVPNFYLDSAVSRPPFCEICSFQPIKVGKCNAWVFFHKICSALGKSEDRVFGGVVNMTLRVGTCI